MIPLNNPSVGRNTVDEPSIPFVTPDTGCGDDDVVAEFGPDGRRIGDELLINPFVTPCTLGTLNGSWLLEITPQRPLTVFHLQPTRGPMRIEASPNVLRISGDVYVKPVEPEVINQEILPGGIRSDGLTIPPEAITEALSWLVINRNSYPAFPQSEYRWYFRSTGVTYGNGNLTFTFARHLWSDAAQDFTREDSGSMSLNCQADQRPISVSAPRPVVRMTGTLRLGLETYNVVATKTSPYYRGCLIEVDVMTNRQWPASVTDCLEAVHTFTSVYRNAAGVDCRVVVNQLDVPEDTQLTRPEMQTLIATHRSVSAGGDNWHMWLGVGSADEFGNFGIMFDDVAPHREGSIGFFDPLLSTNPRIAPFAQGQQLGQVPLAFLRTLVHEAGHAFNLYHPKADVHIGGPLGTTIMNQTGDIINDPSAATNPYPCNLTMGFEEHNRLWLIHGSDPQTKPGWKEFGWGHDADVWSGLPEPFDALGIQEPPVIRYGLRLDLSTKPDAHRGEFIWATATVTNTDTVPRRVTSALNLAQGALRVWVNQPNGFTDEVRDIVILCGITPEVELQPGESISNQFQLFYTSIGLTFDQPGTYTLLSELSIGDAARSVLRGAPTTIVIRPTMNEDELDLARLTMDRSVGLGLALGDPGADVDALERLATVADRYSDHETGAAAAMVVANSLARDLRDVRNGQVLRAADEKRATDALNTALKGRSATRVVELANAVVSPTETSAPLLSQLRQRLRKPRKGTFEESDLAEATRLLSNQTAQR